MNRILKNNSKYSIYVILIVIFSACVSKKNIIYFNNEYKSEKVNEFEIFFKKGDYLNISVFGNDETSNKIFNLPHHPCCWR